jgi:hypothetical protein
MESWSRYVTGETGDNVVAIKRRVAAAPGMIHDQDRHHQGRLGPGESYSNAIIRLASGGHESLNGS